MSRVILDPAVSLDGFVAGPNGEDGGLHDCFFSPNPHTAEVIEIPCSFIVIPNPPQPLSH